MKSALGAKDECQLLRKAEVFVAEHGGFGKPICKVNTLNLSCRGWWETCLIWSSCAFMKLYGVPSCPSREAYWKLRKKTWRALKSAFWRDAQLPVHTWKRFAHKANLPVPNLLAMLCTLSLFAHRMPPLSQHWSEWSHAQASSSYCQLARTGRDISNQGPTGLSRESFSID